MLKPFAVTLDLTSLGSDYFENLGIKGILLDLDDTLIAEHQGEFNVQLLNWLSMLSQAGFKIGIVSNNPEQSYCYKVLRQLRRAKLDIPIIGDALKPFPISFKRMLDILEVRPQEAVLIGDGILTDQIGGWLAGIRTIRAKCFPRAFYYTGPLFIVREVAVCLYDTFRRLVLSHRPKLYLHASSQLRQRKNVLVLINPKSSQTDAALIRQIIEEQAQPSGIKVECVDTTNPPATLRKYRDKIAAGVYDSVVGSGGDGTVRAVIEAIYHIDQAIPIGILPTGTGNLMAKGLGIPMALEDAINLALNGSAQAQSITLVNKKHVALLVVGIGIDAEIMHETTADLKKLTGILAYVIAAIKVSFLKGKALFKLKVDHQRYEHRAEGLIIIQRNHYMKAFLPSAVSAEKNEELLDVCVIQARSMADAIPVVQALFMGEYDSESDILKHYQGSRVDVRMFPNEKVQIDGDIVPLSQIQAELIPDAVSIISPPAILIPTESINEVLASSK